MTLLLDEMRQSLVAKRHQPDILARIVVVRAEHHVLGGTDGTQAYAEDGSREPVF